DGGMSSRTAAIHGTYPVPPHGSGILYFEPDELTEMVRAFDARGFQVCIHAQGDRAIEIVLDAYAAVLAPGQGNPRRHRIEHGGAMYPPLAARGAGRGGDPAAGRASRRAGDRGGDPARIAVGAGRRVSCGVPGDRRRAV